MNWWSDIDYVFFFKREKDLELAARIGRSLLQRNELLEAELGSQLDNRQQLEQQVRGKKPGGGVMGGAKQAYKFSYTVRCLPGEEEGGSSRQDSGKCPPLSVSNQSMF